MCVYQQMLKSNYNECLECANHGIDWVNTFLHNYYYCCAVCIEKSGIVSLITKQGKLHLNGINEFSFVKPVSAYMSIMMYA